MRHKTKGSNPDVAVDDLFFRKTAHSDRLLGRLADERQWNATVGLVNVGPDVALSDVRTVPPSTRCAAARWARLGL